MCNTMFLFFSFYILLTVKNSEVPLEYLPLLFFSGNTEKKHNNSRITSENRVQ